jgi:hypothetical protein
MERRPPPRIHCLPATEAPVVAVLRRGPGGWSHVGRWDLAAARYEPGAWLRGRIFPRRCDLSPDGRFLCYFAHKPGSRWEPGDTYVALSKLPWLTALHAFGTCGTWTRGFFFSRERGDDADPAELPIPSRLRSIPVVQFANERRRGWVEAPDSPPRDPADAWDQRRNARMQKRQPGGEHVLQVQSLGHAGGEFGVDQAVDGLRVRYGLESRGELEPLDDLQWADWDREGRLLVATRCGKLQIRELAARTAAGWTNVCEEDLAPLEPDPAPAPPWAAHW